MSHSYEELRSAAFDVLSGRVQIAYAATQYSHLKIGIGHALRIRENLPPQSHSGFPADAALDSGDAEIFLELFWDLFRQGVITLGLNDSNPQFPWFRLTSLGKKVVEGENGYFVHDVSGYEKRIKNEISKIDDVTLLYLKEALQAFRSDCILSATVMLGVATEKTFLLLVETVEGNATHKVAFASVGKERTILKKVNQFRKIIDQQMSILPLNVKDDLDTNFSGILSIIRNFRNDSGHPSGRIINREQAFVLLQLFPHYCKKMYQLIEHYK